MAKGDAANETATTANAMFLNATVILAFKKEGELEFGRDEVGERRFSIYETSSKSDSDRVAIKPPPYATELDKYSLLFKRRKGKSSAHSAEKDHYCDLTMHRRGGFS